MKIVKRGAEALICEDVFDGEAVIVKERIRKGYRIEQIDSKLRKQRTNREAKLLADARRAGILTPRIIEVDPKASKIVMEKISGVRLKELLNSSKDSEIKELSGMLGKYIGILHANKIFHGDLTTSNMILHEGNIYFIDFSLGGSSQRTEDFATDLSLLKESISSTHHKYLNIIWQSILKGYKKANKASEEVLKRLEKIEMRGRYVERSK